MGDAGVTLAKLEMLPPFEGEDGQRPMKRSMTLCTENEKRSNRVWRKKPQGVSLRTRYRSRHQAKSRASRRSILGVVASEVMCVSTTGTPEKDESENHHIRSPSSQIAKS
jgi:hypothetical protein